MPFTKGHKINSGRKKSIETKRKISISLKGSVAWNKGKSGCYKLSEETKRKIGKSSKFLWSNIEFRNNIVNKLKGIKRSDEDKLKYSNSKKGNKNPMWNGGLPNCKFCGKKLSNYKYKFCNSCKVKYYRGENSHAWKGGKTLKNKILRSSKEFCLWRKAVFERDNYICQKCKIRGSELHPHHIFNLADNKNRIFDINNGITFCKKCHMEFHRRYGRHNNNDIQIAAYILENEKNGLCHWQICSKSFRNYKCK